MSDTVIRVENLSKKYVIKHAGSQRSGDGLRHALQDTLSAPWRAMRRRFQAASGETSSNSDLSSSTSEDFYALRDISFEVKRGEVLGIIGRNGAGKSTLLKILSRITEPTNGRIGIKGRVASLLEVGTGFHPELTGRENIYLNGAILGMTRAEVKGKFEEIVDFSGVETFLDTPVKRYSSGMYVRLAFAVAAHLEPEILVVDEVLAVGDAEFQKKCLGKIKQVARGEGRTVLFVSHNMAAIQSLCDKSLVLHRGRVAFSGDIDKALKAYKTAASQSLATTTSLNAHKPVALLSVLFVTPEGLPTDIWDAAKGGNLRIKYSLKTAVPKLELSLRLEGAMTGIVGTIFAGRSMKGFIANTSGDHEADIELARLPLVPDQYLITAWLHEPMVELFDFQEKIAMVEVTNTACDFATLGSASLIGALLLDPVLVRNVTDSEKNGC